MHLAAALLSLLGGATTHDPVMHCKQLLSVSVMHAFH